MANLNVSNFFIFPRIIYQNSVLLCFLLFIKPQPSFFLDNDSICRSMSNDLELPNCPKAVLRTYSNYGRSDQSSPQRGDMHANSMRVHAINNNFSKQEAEELEMQMSVAQAVSIPMPKKRER